ncbi:MAG: hypothetical protein HC828_09615, partial [Blastochloris sp.]|nr:hypothetical protein [Blastochloris sp.]
MTIEHEEWQIMYDDQGEPILIRRGERRYAVVAATDFAALWHHVTQALTR